MRSIPLLVLLALSEPNPSSPVEGILSPAAWCVPSAQEEPQVQELLARLDDDAIEVRAAAASALTQLGKPALPALKRAAAQAGVELKDRLAEIIRKIQDRERLAALLPPPSRITIHARDLPLREVFEKLSKQTSTAIDYSEVPEDLKVSVMLDGVPLWKAIHQICRASGKVMPEVETDHLAITPEPYIELPGKITDLFCVTLQRIELSTQVGFGQQQDRYEHFSSLFHVSWEKGARPYHVTAHIEELVDENGNELVATGEDNDPLMLSLIAPDLIRQDLMLESSHGPGPQAAKLSKLRVQIEFEFPLKYAELKLDVSAGRTSASADAPEFSLRLARFERQDGVLAATLTMTPHGTLEGEVSSESVVLRDKNGKEYPASVSEGSVANENETPYQLVFTTAPEGAEFVEIVVKIPTEVHRERLDVEFKDLDLK
jgi:hypothetical protein